MTIDEAIYILELDMDVDYLEYHRDSKNALKLSIEALKRINAQRQQYPEISSMPLPGETIKPKREARIVKG